MAAKQTGKTGNRHLVLTTKLALSLSALHKGRKQCRDLGAAATSPNCRGKMTWLIHNSSQPSLDAAGKNGIARRRTTVLPSFIPSFLAIRQEGCTHFKSRQAKNAYNVLVLYRLRDRSMTFTGQP